MKKAIVYFVIAILCVSVQGQMPGGSATMGSWINADVAAFYESGQGHDCSINYFAGDAFKPLYLSFEDDKQVKVTFRIEQTVFTYKIGHARPDSISISRAGNVYQISLTKGVLTLRRKGVSIAFKKVSDHYSTNVFGEFIKGIIFRDHQHYAVASFAESKGHVNGMFDRRHFKQQIKALFKCDHVDMVQLGSFKWEDACLPEIALYYDSGSKWSGPRVLGIKMEENAVKLIDNTGADVLILVDRVTTQVRNSTTQKGRKIK